MNGKKKKVRKNSNYQQTYRYVSIDRLCRKTLCDLRNRPSMQEVSEEERTADEILYETAVELCCVAGVLSREEKAVYFDGQNHVALSEEKISEFTGIPLYQLQKNLFAFRIRTSEDYMRASVIKLAMCDLVATLLRKASEEGRKLTEEETKNSVGYINFCAFVGLISEEQCSLLYFSLKNNQPLELSMIASVTGINEETLQKMMV